MPTLEAHTFLSQHLGLLCCCSFLRLLNKDDDEDFQQQEQEYSSRCHPSCSAELDGMHCIRTNIDKTRGQETLASGK